MDTDGANVSALHQDASTEHSMITVTTVRLRCSSALWTHALVALHGPSVSRSAFRSIKFAEICVAIEMKSRRQPVASASSY